MLAYLSDKTGIPVDSMRLRPPTGDAHSWTPTERKTAIFGANNFTTPAEIRTYLKSGDMIYVDDARQSAPKPEAIFEPEPHGVFKQTQQPVTAAKIHTSAFTSKTQSGGRIATLSSLSERRFFYDTTRSIPVSEIMNDSTKKV